MPRTRPIALALVLSAATASAITTGCKDDSGSLSAADTPSEVARVLCAAYFDCSCPNFDDPDRYTSEEQCIPAKEADVQAALDEGEAAGLTYDGACVSKQLAAADDIGCKSLADYNLIDLSALVGDLDCKAFYGDKAAGASCTTLSMSDGDDCAADLRCKGGVCTAMDPEPGAPCDYSPSADQNQDCSGGAICMDVDNDGAGVCETLPGTGGTCLGALNLCEPYLTCDQGSKKCTAAPGDGQPCAQDILQWNQCAEGTTCDAGTCRTLPGGGEPCLQNQCAQGFSCEAGTCVQARPIVCDDLTL